MSSIPPPPGPKPLKHLVLRNLVALVIVVMLITVFALKTLSKDVIFEADCETLPIPAPVTLDLVHPGTTVIAAVEAIAFDGEAHAAAILFDPSGKDHLAPVVSKGFHLKANAGVDQSRSGIRVGQFKDPFGRMQLLLSPPALLKSTGSPGGAPKLIIQDVLPGRAKLTMGAMQMDIDGNDYLLSGLANQDRNSRDFKVEIKGGGLILQPGPQPRAEATLTFQRNSGLLSLPIQTAAGPTPSRPVRLAFGGCLDAKVRINGKSLETLNARSDFEIISDSGNLDELSIIGEPKDSQAPALRAKATARSKSLKQNGRNLIPNLIEEATADPLAARNLWMLPLAGLAWLAFEILKRAAGKLLDAILGS